LTIGKVTSIIARTILAAVAKEIGVREIGADLFWGGVEIVE
jgi:hypothetical protein